MHMQICICILDYKIYFYGDIMRNQKAITLVALVITIIVMLILAGVSISMVTGDNGVLTKAQEGAIKTILSSIQSDIGLALTSIQTDYYNSFAEAKVSVGEKWTYLTVEKLNNYLNECKLIYDCSDNNLGINIKNEGSFRNNKFIYG